MANAIHELGALKQVRMDNTATHVIMDSIATHETAQLLM
jgi:hypothetical protein